MNRPTLLFVLAFVAGDALAGTNGILEGVVLDKTTREPVVGANIVLVVAHRGTTTDVEGRFALQNVRAGVYELRCTHLGFRGCVLKNVTINPDLRTRLTLSLEPSEVEFGEVTVVQERPLIQTDVTGTTYAVSGEEINALPVQNASEVIRLKAGVTVEGNIRGGKTTEVVYLVDGLPVQDVLTGELSTRLPNSSIVGLSLYTGGFEPEYGNALSGVVNIVTKGGTNDHRFFVRGQKDHLFGGTQVSRENEFEVSASGPIQTDKVYYFGSLNGLYTDTRWWQDFQYFFKSPIDKQINGFGKIDVVFTPVLRVGTQVLYSHRDWHDYEFNWRFNLSGLPAEQRTSYRVAAFLSHTPSESFFYTASVSRFFLDSQIGGDPTDALALTQPYEYDFFLRYIIRGNRLWHSSTKQETYTAKGDGTFKVSGNHLVKFGGEVSVYSLNSDLIKYEPRKTYFGKPLVNEPLLNFSSTYTYHPRSGALYIQDKADFLEEGILLNFGVRYDFLDPTAERPAIEAIPIADTGYAFAAKGMTPAKLKHQLSPRMGAAMQLAENGYLFVNIGWYFQYPLFDYLYTGLDRVAIAKGVSAITGNPDLEPERTKSYEISIRYALAHNIVASVTYFRKETSNQIDTKTFIPGDSKLAGTFGFAEYVNNPFADATGYEVVVSRDRGEWVTGEVSYSYMHADGTSGSAQDNFYIAQYGLPPATRVYPLSWDQRHTVKALVQLVTPWSIGLALAAEYHTGRPYTNYPTSTGFEPVNRGLFVQNNARMPRYVNADLKVEAYLTPGWWPNARLKLYLDVRNLTNTQNVKWVDSNGRIGGELGDPSGYFMGRRTHVGAQIEF
jgi:outer membrane receptor protein involved in Fe transport